VLLDASALEEGDGGEIVVWSDINNPSSYTEARGTLLARGGLQGGNGGRIETSGYHLDVAGIDINLAPFLPSYAAGEWLIDPFNITIVSGGMPTVNPGWSNPYQSGNGSWINAADIVSALNSANVSITTGDSSSPGLEAGSITISDPLVTNTNSNTLELTAASQIDINADITRSGDGDLILNAGTVTGSSNVSLNGGTFTINQSGNSTYSGQIKSVDSSFTKAGVGELILSGIQTYEGPTNVNSGTLLVQGSLSNNTDVAIASGATYRLGSNDQIQSVGGAGTLDLGIYALAVANTADLSLTGLSGASSSAFTKAGTGSLNLIGDNDLALMVPTMLIPIIHISLKMVVERSKLMSPAQCRYMVSLVVPVVLRRQVKVHFLCPVLILFQGQQVLMRVV
jgi:autotransporter-associated beta strand protein